MKENKEKREFARQLEQIAETLTQAVKKQRRPGLYSYRYRPERE